MLVIVSSIYFFNRYSSSLINEVLQQYVLNQTNGTYELEYEKIDVNLITRNIRIINAAVHPTGHFESEETENKNQYDIAVGLLEITLKSLFRLYWYRELLIEEIYVEEPEIVISGDRIKNRPFTGGVGDLYLLISDYFNLLKIDVLTVNSASLLYGPTDIFMEKLSFELRNFKLDSLPDDNRIVYSEELSVEVEKQSLLLPDSLHSISFDALNISTTDSILTFDNFKLTPLEGVRDTANTYNIEVPKMLMRGIDYLRAYTDNDLVVDSLVLTEPNVDVSQIMAPTPKLNRKPVNEILLSIFNQVSINYLGVGKAAVQTKIKDYSFVSEWVDIGFHNIGIDSTNYNFKRTTPWVDAADIKFTNSILTRKSDTLISFYKLNMVSRDKDLIVEKVKLYKPGITAEKLIINGFDIVEVYESEQLAVNSIWVEKLSLVYPLQGGKKDTMSFISPSAVYKAVSPLVKSIRSNTIVLKDINLDTDNLSFKGFEYTATDLNFTDTLTNWNALLKNEYAQIVEVAYTYGNLQLTTGIDYKGEENKVILRGAKIIKPEPKSVFTSGPITVFGVNWDDIQEDFKTDSIILNNPEINWVLSGQPPKGQPSLRTVLGKIKVNDGHLDLTLRNGNVVNSGDFNLELIKRSEGFRVNKIEGKKIILHNKKSDISLSQVDYNKFSGHLMLTGVAFAINNQADSISITIPEIRGEDWDQERWRTDETFKFDVLEIKDADIRTLNITSDEKSTNQSLPRVVANQLIISNANWSSRATVGKKLSYQLREIDANITGFDTEDNQWMSNTTLLFGDGAELSVGQTTIAGEKFSTSFRNFIYTLSDDRFMLYNLTVKNGDNVFNIPSLAISGLNRQELVENNNLLVEDMNIIAASFDFYQTGNKKTARSFKLPFNKTIVSSLALDNSSFTYHYSKDKAMNFNNLYIGVSSISLDSIVAFDQLLGSLGSFDFSGSDFNIPVDGGNYELKVSDYSYNYDKSSFALNDIRLIPRLDKFAFSKTLEYQMDWFDVVVGQVNIDELDLEGFLADEVLHIKKVGLNKVDAEIFRDKHLPFNANKFRPLPQKVIKGLSLALKIDTVTVQGRISYSERPKTTQNLATITFNELGGHLVNVSSRDSLSDLPMYLRAQGRILKTGNFTANVTFDMEDPKNPFLFQGEVQQMDLEEMNELLRPIAAIEIKSGETSGASINFEGNNEVASGTIDFKYKNLRVVILNPETHDKQGFGQGLKTFFANTFVIKQSNPSWFNFRDGLIFFKRDQARAIYNFWGKSILSGVVSSVGINKSKRSFLKYKQEEQDKKNKQ